jgi:hypothetical protein
MPIRKLRIIRIRRGWPPWRRARAVVRHAGTVADIDRGPGGWTARLRPYAGNSGPDNCPAGGMTMQTLRALGAALETGLSTEGPWWWAPGEDKTSDRT